MGLQEERTRLQIHGKSFTHVCVPTFQSLMRVCVAGTLSGSEELGLQSRWEVVSFSQR